MASIVSYVSSVFFFFFNDTATTEIYTLSLHDALPVPLPNSFVVKNGSNTFSSNAAGMPVPVRSEEHTSELQSRPHLVCRLLLEKKKKKKKRNKQQKKKKTTQKTKHKKENT